LNTLWTASSVPATSDAAPVTRAYAALPVLVIGTWWLVCFTFYVTGWPIQYNRGNVGLVTLLFAGSLILTLVAFAFVAWRKPFQARQPLPTDRPGRLPWAMIVAVIAIVALYAPLAETYSGFHFWEVIPALSDQGRAYQLASERIGEGTTSRLLLVGVQAVLAPLTMAALPFLALRWFEARRHLPALLIVLVLAVFTSVLGGRDFQLVLSAVLVAIAWFVSRVRRGIGFRWRDLMVFGGVGVVGILVFGLRKQSRMGSQPYCPEGADVCAIPNAPTLWDTITVTVSSYLSQGFEGLGRALDATWSFGGGYSHSPALAGFATTLFGVENDDVVTAQLDGLDWSATANWSTGFAMIANDVPWVLVPVVVALQAALLAFAWRATVVRGDWLSVAAFSYTFVALFFMPMNLQLTISGPIYLGYLALLVLFAIRELVARRRRNDPERSDTAWSIAGRPVF
jgi:hypothetical protein